jgi:glycosyltransferase involved in cell wall biosynthesis
MASFLERAIRSVLDQNYTNLEYIIIDGGSRDGSVEIIKKYEQHLAYWVSEKDQGQSDALNKGLKFCSGDIIAWLNADDYYEPGVLETVSNWFIKNPEKNILVGACRMFGVGVLENMIQPKTVNKGTLTAYWQSYFVPPQPSIFFSKSMLDKVGILDTRLHYAMDLDLWLRMSRYEEFVCIPEVLSNYEIHTESKSGSGDGFDKFEKEWKQVCDCFVAGMPLGFRIKHNLRKVFFIAKKSIAKSVFYINKCIFFVLGIVVRAFKKLTGIKRLGVLSAEK